MKQGVAKLIKLGNYQFRFNRFWDRIGRDVIETTVLDSKGKLISIGSTKCSTKDQFSKKIGRKKSLAKAIQLSSIPKEDRAKIWEDYRTGMTSKPRW